MRKRGFAVLVFMLPVFFSAFLGAYIANQKPFLLFPNPDYEDSFGFYTDANIGGDSRVLTGRADSGAIRFRYELNQSDVYKYAGLSLLFYPEPEFYPDFSRFDTLQLELQSTTSRDFVAAFELNQEGITEIGRDESYRVVSLPFSVGKEKATHSLRLKNFTTPFWWLQKYKLPRETDRDRARYRSVRLIKLNEQVGTTVLPASRENAIVITELLLKKDFTPLLVVAAAGVGLYYLVLFSLRRRHRLQTVAAPSPLPEYTKLFLENSGYRDLKKVLEVINAHYFAPGFSAPWIVKETGLSAAKINSLLYPMESGFPHQTH